MSRHDDDSSPEFVLCAGTPETTGASSSPARIEASPTVYFEAVTHEIAAGLIAVSKPALRDSPWGAQLEESEISRYRLGMNRGQFPQYSAVLRFDTAGVLLSGLQILKAFHSSDLDTLTFVIVAGLPVATAIMTDVLDEVLAARLKKPDRITEPRRRSA